MIDGLVSPQQKPGVPTGSAPCHQTDQTCRCLSPGYNNQPCQKPYLLVI